MKNAAYSPELKLASNPEPIPLFHHIGQEHDNLRKGDHEACSDDERKEKGKNPLEEMKNIIQASNE